MSAQMTGAVLGLLAAAGVLLVVWRVAVIRRPALSARVLPYLRDLPQSEPWRAPAAPVAIANSPAQAAVRIFGPSVQRAADLVERLLGGSASVRRRLDRAGLDIDLHEFRIQQVYWGLAAFAGVAALQIVRALSGQTGLVAALVTCVAAFGAGVVFRDNRLTAAVRDRERQMLVEFPALAELLALSVAAGESPVAALDRVVKRSHGALSDELGKVLARIRTGEPVIEAFDRLAATTGLPLVSRFATGVSVSLERGTPLADVLHAQAGDVREAGRRELIETGARREVAMMAPVVFLVLPVTVLFAFFPGAVSLSLMAP